jgi:hypothetical protein
MFNAFTHQWLLDFEEANDWAATFGYGDFITGMIQVSSLMKDAIFDYFTAHNIRPENYFDDKIKKIDLTTDNFQNVLSKLNKQYKLQKYLSGQITPSQYKEYSTALHKQYNRYSGTMEYELSIKWSSIVDSYEYGKSQPPHYDPFLWMLKRIDDASLQYHHQQTIHQRYGASKLPNNLRDPKQQPQRNAKEHRNPTGSADSPAAHVNQAYSRYPRQCPCGQMHSMRECEQTHTWSEADQLKNIKQLQQNRHSPYFDATIAKTLQEKAKAWKEKNKSDGNKPQPTRPTSARSDASSPAAASSASNPTAKPKTKSVTFDATPVTNDNDNSRVHHAKILDMTEDTPRAVSPTFDADPSASMPSQARVLTVHVNRHTQVFCACETVAAPPISGYEPSAALTPSTCETVAAPPI